VEKIDSIRTTRAKGESMRKLVRGTVVGAALALIVAAAAFAKPESVRVGNLVLTHDGGISPTALPRHGQAPVDAFVTASIATADGSHLPAAREAVIDLDKNVRVNAKGLPACTHKQLESRDTKAAKRVCAGAVVGRGSARVEIAFPEQAPVIATSPLTMFNGGVRGGRTTIFIHAFLTVPVPAAVVTTVVLTPTHRGPYGTRIVARVPAIAGGAGSLTDARLKINRKFIYRGRRSSYLTAGCPANRHLVKGRVLFDDETLVQLSRVLPCTPLDPPVS
jgi:hypothetical protein